VLPLVTTSGAEVSWRTWELGTADVLLQDTWTSDSSPGLGKAAVLGLPRRVGVTEGWNTDPRALMGHQVPHVPGRTHLPTYVYTA
jgi:hypothetical protein